MVIEQPGKEDEWIPLKLPENMVNPIDTISKVKIVRVDDGLTFKYNTETTELTIFVPRSKNDELEVEGPFEKEE